MTMRKTVTAIALALITAGGGARTMAQTQAFHQVMGADRLIIHGTQQPRDLIGNLIGDLIGAPQSGQRRTDHQEHEGDDVRRRSRCCLLSAFSSWDRGPLARIETNDEPVALGNQIRPPPSQQRSGRNACVDLFEPPSPVIPKGVEAGGWLKLLLVRL